MPPALKCRVLTTGLPGKSQTPNFCGWYIYFLQSWFLHDFSFNLCIVDQYQYHFFFFKQWFLPLSIFHLTHALVEGPLCNSLGIFSTFLEFSHIWKCLPLNLKLNKNVYYSSLGLPKEEYFLYLRMLLKIFQPLAQVLIGEIWGSLCSHLCELFFLPDGPKN